MLSSRLLLSRVNAARDCLITKMETIMDIQEDFGSSVNSSMINAPLAANINTLDLSQIPIVGAVSLGFGYAVRTCSMRNAAIKDDSTETAIPSIRPEYSFEYVDNYFELAKRLNVSASASYGSAGVSGGSASLSMMRATEMKSSSAYVVLWMRVIAKENSIKTAYLTNEALEILNNQSSAQFYEKFGSKFIRALYYGGELACIMEFSSNQTISSEAFRAQIRGEVGLAKASGEIDSWVMSLTSGHNVHIRYAQSGGATATASAGGIYIASPAELTNRIQTFADEVIGTNGLNGSTVPVYADVLDFKAALNWPSNRDADFENPYPNEIENIAQSILLLQDQTSIVRGILISTNPPAPGILAAAHEFEPYLKYLTTETTKSLRAMMSDGKIPTQLHVESFHQYRLRNLLNVASSAIRDNAGPSCDFAEPDKNLLKTCLFGSANLLEIKPWPELEITGSWGFQGERDDWGPAPEVSDRVPCPQHGGSIQKRAEDLAGKTGPNDGRFGFAQGFPRSYSGGGACGYTVVHFTAIKVLREDRNPLPELPRLPSIPVGGVIITPGMPVASGLNHWNIPFTINMPAATSCGRYELKIGLIDDIGNTRDVTVISYWYKEGQSTLSLTHPLALDNGWKIASVSGVVGAAFSSQ